MEVRNPDAQLAINMSRLSRKELRDVMKQCQTIFENIKKSDKIKKKQINEKNRSICEILFDY